MRIFTIVIALALLAAPVQAQDNACKADDKPCLLNQLESIAGEIPEKNWRDQTYRELAKLLTRENQRDKALALLARIENPDTKAMTIRAIAIDAAKMKLASNEYKDLFTALKVEANKITHKPSQDIAMNYIADGQALSGDDPGSMETAMSIENAEMRNKALYDSSKYQAERGDLEHAAASIDAIDSPAFRDKAHRAVSKIFADKEKYADAMNTAMAIDNSYQKAQALLYILAKQITPEEVSLVEE